MDPAFLTIAELGRHYDSRELSPVEVTRALLDRIATYDGGLHSFIRVTPEVALAEARAAEERIMQGGPRGPFCGIPYALKDIVETAGIATTGHSKLCADYVPTADAFLVTRLKSAGAVLLGKLATWEFALGGPSWDLPWPPALNPWNPHHLPGGSSSGAGAAVAAGFVPAAIGTDTGGSIRGPAAWCGIAGLKPTYGRVSRRGVFGNTFTMDHCGPMTRSVEDIALMLQVIAGYDAEDPGSEEAAVPDYRAALAGGVAGLRLGVVANWYREAKAHPELGPAIAAALDCLRAQGAIVEEVRLSSLRDYTDCKTTISIAELYAIHEPDLKTRPQDFGRILRNRVLPGALIRAEDYVEALRWRTVLAQEQAATLRRFDALVTAAALHPAEPAIRDAPDRLVSAPSITMPFSVGGLPALAIPCGFTRGGLPLSLQIAAAPMAEATVLRVAQAYQQATDWHRRHPDLAAPPAAAVAAPETASAPVPPAAPSARRDLSHLPPSTPAEIRVMVERAGLSLPDELLQQFTAVWPGFEAMVRRLPRGYPRAAEPAHSYRPTRIAR
jgi:aspartyl-tRNA(Asn)/glutamyl-tRNA(Gln) amidotransferase subunit A